MKKELLYLLIVTLFSCDQGQKTDTTVDIKKESKFKKLLSKFKDVSIDTLKVYSPEYSSEKLTGEFIGTELDSTDAILFPNDIALQHFIDMPGLYAIYKFQLDSNTLGLITRTPSEYFPSSIKLFYLDRKKDSITSYLELADSWGDAGDYMSKESWLFKDSLQKFHAFTWVMEGHDNSVDNEKDTTTQEWNYYYLLDISKPKVDTIIKDEKKLIKKFANIMKSKASRLRSL
jgi:hypothetical protein